VSLFQIATAWHFPDIGKGRSVAVATFTFEPDEPLSQSQLCEVGAARDRAGKIRKAAAVAKFNGWMTGIVAACSAPFALFSFSGFLVTVVLSLVAYNELKGRRRLLQFDRDSPAFLGWNQVGFLALITLYCTWMIGVGLTSEDPFSEELKAKPELQAVFDSPLELDQTYRLLVVVVYGTVIVLSVVFQGLNALYYFSRRKHVEAYLQDTPEWVLDLQRLTLSA
jgi:hypothetical protein